MRTSAASDVACEVILSQLQFNRRQAYTPGLGYAVTTLLKSETADKANVDKEKRMVKADK